MTRFAKQPWKILLVFMVVAAALSVVRNAPLAASRGTTADAPADATEGTGALQYKADPAWPKTLPPGRPETSGLNRQMGSTNGDVAVRVDTAGSRRGDEHRPKQDAFMAARLRDGGAVILGETNLSEWASFRSTRSTSGWGSRGGQTKNRYVLDRKPCGSSIIWHCRQTAI